eukprot:6475946-Amphidinium_carterae.2
MIPSDKAAFKTVIVRHLLDILAASSIKLSNGQKVSFETLGENLLFGIIVGKTKQHQSRMRDDLYSWVTASCKSANTLYLAWEEVTRIAFATASAQKPCIIVDEAESLGKTTNQSTFGGPKSLLSDVCSCLPKEHAALCVGTLDVVEQQPAELYIMVRQLPLEPLTFKGATEMMNG